VVGRSYLFEVFEASSGEAQLILAVIEEVE
jgi:hypothetical protein